MEIHNQSVIVIVFFIVLHFCECSRIIIVEDAKACFRRALAGKCVDKAFVRRSVHCERVEDCQQECSEEKRFVCEGFNYRLDPTGRGQGDCELLDLPLSRLNLRSDVHNSPDYDYYERDRNAATDCRPKTYGSYGHYGGSNYYSRPSGFGYGYDDRHSYNKGSGYSYDDWHRRRGESYGDRTYDRHYVDNYRPYTDRRGDFFGHSYHAENNQQKSHNYNYYYSDKSHHNYNYDSYDSYLPFYEKAPYDYKSYEPYLPSYDVLRPNKNRDTYRDRYYYEKEKNRDHWGLNKNTWGSYGGYYGNFDKHYDYDDNYNNNIPRKYLPSKIPSKDWGQYGGSYGNGGKNFIYVGYKDSYDYWGLGHDNDYYNVKRPSSTYLPSDHRPGYYYHTPKNVIQRPEPGLKYLPASYDYGNNDRFGGSVYMPDRNLIPPIKHGIGDGSDVSGIYPPTQFDRPGHNFVKEECSLRTATGFRLHKGIVKRFYSVPNIYECELLCFKETNFICRSYAFRYTISLSTPTDNCYVSDKDYKTLNFYTELEPDRDFDIYTMNNRNKCEQPMIKGKDHSDCFWHLRSGQKLDHKVVRDSVSVKSIVDCQIECLRSMKFICRAFSFRFGSAVIGGAIDNCQLTDWPYIDLEPMIHMIPEAGFEIYDRGSYGHGCEPDHFSIRGKYIPEIGAKTDQLCYVGYGKPAKLLLQAVRKSLKVNTEFECRLECTKARQETLFQCMSFSYCVTSERGEPNCFLSDIYQRDLLAEVDYIPDPDSWLFAWDNYNPKCVAIAASGPNFIGHDGGGSENRGLYGLVDPLKIWRTYSVNGYPCRRGSVCEENQEAGFWFCYLEGADHTTWDYCCRPDHQCGYSEGFQYQWCYVGPIRSQWRKCSDRYYPYSPNFVDRHDTIRPPAPYPPSIPPHDHLITSIKPPLPGTETTLQPPHRPGFRPDRPPALPTTPPPKTSLDQYEHQFQSQFLDPPKPGGFGQPRHWPVSYLHKETPFNESGDMFNLRLANMRSNDEPLKSKIEAIHNLIKIIKSNDLDDVVKNTSNLDKSNNSLHLALPLTNNMKADSKNNDSTVVPLKILDLNINDESVKANRDRRISNGNSFLPINDTTKAVYRRGFVTRTNVKNYGRRWANLERDRTEYRIIV